jgi:hypothetical protein
LRSKRPGYLKNNSAKALNNDLNAVIKSVNGGAYATAINKLQKATLTKVDGCAKTGQPDKNDLIVKCPAQTTVYSELNGIIQELQALQGS